MELFWTEHGHQDLQREHATLLAQLEPAAAAAVTRRLALAPNALLSQPRQGERMKQYDKREVRRLTAGPYQIHYEIKRTVIWILSLTRSQERRP